MQCDQNVKQPILVSDIILPALSYIINGLYQSSHSGTVSQTLLWEELKPVSS